MNKEITSCQLCNALIADNKFNILQRSRYSDDNLEDILEDFEQYTNPIEEESCFSLQGISIEEFKQYYLSITFNDKYNLGNDKELLIKRFSEIIPFNFCFVCGRQLVKEGNIIDENDHRIEIE